MISGTDDVCLGVLPNGSPVYCSHNIIAQIGMEKARYELVDRAWIAESGSVRGYYPVRTDLNGNYIMVRADSHQQAIEKYLNRHKTLKEPT